MLVETQKDLEAQFNLLKGDKYIAVDTEFIRDRCYYPKLSLIQFAGRNTCFAVDMLKKEIDIKLIAEILTNHKIIKIFHDARQDLEVIYYHLGIVISNIFDTQLAALFLGVSEPPSYHKLINYYLDKQINKELQWSKWLKRPLSDALLEYALLDVKLLYEVYPLILKNLKLQNKTRWMQEECKAISQVKKFIATEEDLLKKAPADLNNKQDLLYLLQLLRIREEVAKDINLSRNYVAATQDLVSAVKKRKLSTHLLDKLGEKADLIFKKDNRVKVSKQDKLLVNRIFKQKYREYLVKNELYELLRVLLLLIANKWKISAFLIASNNDILRIASALHKNNKLLKGWRKKVIGDIAIKVCSGEYGLFIESGKITLKAKS